MFVLYIDKIIDLQLKSLITYSYQRNVLTDGGQLGTATLHLNSISYMLIRNILVKVNTTSTCN